MRRWVCDLERDLAVMGEELHHLGSRTVLRTQSAQEVTHARQQLCDDIGLVHIHMLPPDALPTPLTPNE